MARKLMTMDGNTAAAHVSYAFTDMAAIYPITPSSNMAEYVDAWAAGGRENIFGQAVRVVEMQSEAGAAGAVHGSVLAGALTTTFTASQGLLLMIPNMYKIAGEQMPAVIHVSARTISTHALSIFGDHSDVMACRQTGFAMIASTSPQEVMDLGAVSHLAAVKGSMPFLHFFDGFRTSHEMQKIEAWDYNELKAMFDNEALEKFHARANVPAHPVLRGSAQNGDIFFQAREACNTAYDDLAGVVEECMNQVNAQIGTDYKPFNYYGPADATHVLVAMGSVCDTIEEVVDHLTATGEKVGLIKVRLYRPFSVKHLLSQIPESVKTIGVLDRTKEPGGVGEPLYLDIVTALRRTDIKVVGGRYGLASKDTTPGQIIAAFRNIQADSPRDNFTIGIEDDVTNLSLKITEAPDTTPAGIKSCKFWGIGSDGTVGANKNSIKIIGEHTDMKVQAYFQYDSRKSGGVTISHLRFGSSPIKSTYYISKADFVACHVPAYLEQFDLARDVKPGGVFLANCAWDVDEFTERMPAEAKRHIAENGIQLYTCDAVTIVKELGLGGRINTILQAAFFKLSGILQIDEAIDYMKQAVQDTYGSKGEAIVNMNNAAIDKGVESIKKIDVPDSWKTAETETMTHMFTGGSPSAAKYATKIMTTMNVMKGDNLPVSAFVETEGGSLIPAGTSRYEKRAINADAPLWLPENCIQCNQCAYVCPHSVIRPFVLDEAEFAAAPEGLQSLKMMGTGNEKLRYCIIASVLDCTGCGSCANVCPSKTKAIEMVAIDKAAQTQKYFDYAEANVSEKKTGFATNTVKGSQFLKPLLEFPGACAGCGETPYARLIAQLFGDRMFIANATGCSSIWAGSAPSTPYTVNKDGRGPAWANSLFEDNAEFGYGMALGFNQRRDRLVSVLKKLVILQAALVQEVRENPVEEALHESPVVQMRMDEPVALERPEKSAAQEWLENKDNADATKKIAPRLIRELENCKEKACENLCKEALSMQDLFVKPSVWIFGGDGWAYDIGYGGLDHVIASGENVNILVFDTEVYSNTGGQASKSTPTGAVAQFAHAGKSIKKKDLGQMAMTYGYVYVAQIAMGANYQQTLNAIIEAESYDGPSIVIAYSPCIAHGLKVGMGRSIEWTKKAVEAGYWNMYRFDPRLALEGKNPLMIDNKPPRGSFNEFIMGEVRYSSLALTFPERSQKLFPAAEKQAKERYEQLIKQQQMFETTEKVLEPK
ncbi:MAG: pyruvate:ferredoxin (flavodoxin) oxidoreductase [Oscillospiraceae bacterium]|nr:pyruvate:ferredoxin (flavodoxin) oxidoreductase [Oscillospiraceae bacterium]